MFIAHFPAGFILTHALIHQQHAPDSLVYKRLLWLGLCASVFPDSDFIYFYLVDAQQHFHHSYWTHIPLYWFALYMTTLLISAAVGTTLWLRATHVFFLNVLLHCALDTTAGGILWLFPWDLHYFRLAHVPHVYNGFYTNFLLHWTFLLELLIIAVASILAWRIRHYFVPVSRGSSRHHASEL